MTYLRWSMSCKNREKRQIGRFEIAMTDSFSCRAATYDYIHYQLICQSIFFILSIACVRCSQSQFPRAQSDIFKLLLLAPTNNQKPEDSSFNFTYEKESSILILFHWITPEHILFPFKYSVQTIWWDLKDLKVANSVSWRLLIIMDPTFLP